MNKSKGVKAGLVPTVMLSLDGLALSGVARAPVALVRVTPHSKAPGRAAFRALGQGSQLHGLEATAHRSSDRRAMESLTNKPAGEPIGMKRAKAWSVEVEEAFRLQEAGYRSLQELLALGADQPERWHDSGFIRKLQTRESWEGGKRVLLYFKQTAECEQRYLNRVKLYTYA
jgi:hypothetical protein